MDDTPNVTNKNIKATVDKEYAAKPHGGSKTPGIMIGMVVILLILFGLALVVFFLAFNHPPTHEITVVNNSLAPMNILFGITNSSNTEFLPVLTLAAGQNHTYRATPGTEVIVQGFRTGDIIVTSGLNPFTTVSLILASLGFTGKQQITDGTVIITGSSNITSYSLDFYGVSVQGGYNVPISIYASNYFSQDPVNPFSCRGPNWTHTITATGPNACPTELQSPSSNYQVCLNPCTEFGTTGFCCTAPNSCSMTSGCQQGWDPFTYYTVFADACPNCQITNCDLLKYSCSSNTGVLSQYTIVFLPS